MRPPEDEYLGKLNETKPELINMAVNLGMMTGCGACGNVTNQQKCSFCIVNPRTNKCKSLRFNEYCDSLKAQEFAGAALPKISVPSGGKEDEPLKSRKEFITRPSEYENLGKLNEIKSELINMAVNLGMITGCGACGNVSDQEKCSFCVISPSTKKCNSLRFGEYCDHLEAQKLSRIN